MKETLLEFDDIIKELDLLFLDIPVDVSVALSDVILKKSKLDLNTLNQLEITLKTSLPETFKEVILKYDCGDLTLGGVTFGYQDNYAEYLVKRNTEKGGFLSWWGLDTHPFKYLSIADSDGFVILLDTETAQILAYERIESYSEAQVIASNFKLFLQAAGTIYIKLITGESKENLINIPNCIGSFASNNFWNEVIGVV